MEFRDLDLIELDKDLSEEQLKEWNAIYASYRARSVLTGKVVGMDTNTITFPNKETTRPEHVLRSMTGATIDYVITGIDRESDCYIASRRLAMGVRRHSFLNSPPEPAGKFP